MFTILHHIARGFPAAAWKRLLKNKGAVIGLCIITLAVFTAVFAYMLAPDHSPDANTMILEISGRPPGFSVLMLKIKKQEPVQQVSWFHRLLYGAAPAYHEVPVNSYAFHDSTITVQQYIDEETSAPARYNLKDIVLPQHQLSRKTYWLGTDKYGRDILSRLIIGVRVSLGVGLIAMLISLSVGIVLGAIAGYSRGRVDDVIMWIINITWSVPTLLLVFAITVATGKGFWQIFIAVGLTLWVSVARIVRGQVIGLRGAQFVEAARVLGYTDRRIILHHILPNILGPVMVVAANNFATAIVIEAGLSFLGIGVQPPAPSWGLMIRENYGLIITHYPMAAIAPGIAIMLLVLAFNLLGNGLRDALDVRGKVNMQ